MSEPLAINSAFPLFSSILHDLDRGEIQFPTLGSDDIAILEGDQTLFKDPRLIETMHAKEEPIVRRFGSRHPDIINAMHEQIFQREQVRTGFRLGDLAYEDAGHRGARVLALDTNPGYSGGCNHGLARSSGKLVFFLNADVMAMDHCMAPLVSLLWSGMTWGSSSQELFSMRAAPSSSPRSMS
ncbi:MAG: glycosyltransferase [Planctomycetota bacterium]